MTEPLLTVPADKPPLAVPLLAPTEEVRRGMTAEVTRRIAAIVLAQTDFPGEGDLPRLAPVPYNHLGHQVLLDYHRLALILWSTVHEIQEGTRKSPRRFLGLLPLGCIFVGFAVGFAASSLAGLSRDAAHAALLVSVTSIVGLILGFILVATLRLRVERIAAEVRARNLKLLLQGKEPASVADYEEAQVSEKSLAAWGDASLGEGVCPVLVITADEDPFPGFGRHQAKQLFVCRPDEEKERLALSPDALSDAVSETMIALVRNSGIPCVSSGSVVLIDGRTLSKDSPWLRTRGCDGEPPLFWPDARLGAVREVDPQASVRVYTCIQTLLPEYLMCLTFFVRTFFAGNSAACEVSVATLGPPIADWDYIRERLRLYDRDQRRSDKEGIGYEADRTTPLGTRLANVRFSLEKHSRSFTSQARFFHVRDLAPFDRVALHHEKWQAKRIAEAGEQWPGLYTGLPNWRERYSLTFTTDFFGNTESRAVLKTLFDRICRSALNRLKELGFDIRDYQDESGHFSINADAIEHLVVGERVYMERQPKAGAGEAKVSSLESKT